MQIVIQDLELKTRIGVPDEERAEPQSILATITMQVSSDAGTTDDIADTVDYERVYSSVWELAKTERHTLEKFAEDIAQAILSEDRVESVTIKLTKHILPQTKGVEVSLTKSRNDS